ncbi:metallophosphoesterase [Flavobacterium sp. NKUCC04_CG]|uniref:metallophosphoesterase n=1 Tax=Flavobacterium sp. NKUCC04_CG TaxID=2842121 RepID=UPI001C5A90AB|nr:metallophosphoesterase [Flavobacterium sp. NKUCC04_CG]MBW3517863.1 metallophosphoesterase [Flavobacterium sp. NKUCC04_CG]
MKIFFYATAILLKYRVFSVIFLVLLLNSCATHKKQYGSAVVDPFETVTTDSANIAHTFYLIGDAGNAEESKAKRALALFSMRLSHANKNSTLLFLGDNIYPRGMPAMDAVDRKLAERKIDEQIALAKDFKGKSVFINGNHDWYNGYDGVVQQANYITEKLSDKKAFLPRKTCGFERLKISDEVVLLVIDSEWFLQDWDKHPKINENCSIKTREDFFEELRSELNKNQNKTIVIAMHHPVYSNGSHGGYFSAKKHLFPYKNIPAPILGSLVNYLRKVSGASPQEIQNKRYSELANRVRTLVQGQDNIVIVSGHEHTQQYIEKDGVKQVISGAGSKEEEARAIQPISFSSGRLGYATLEILKDGASSIQFYTVENGREELAFSRKIITPLPPQEFTFLENKSAVVASSIYPKAWTVKGGAYRFIWGDHYRKYYGMDIVAPTLYLEDIHGGLKPKISGGGNQSLSLRLESGEGKEYVMRGVKKSASRFVQSAVFKDQYVEEAIKGTFAERFIYDFYTTAHPFTPFIIGDLSEYLGIYHTNPELYYIPKQQALGRYNAVYGGELYMIEERPTDGHEEEESFGNAAVIISTDDVMNNLRKDEKYKIDDTAYLKARLFDMLIGDWDRHADQWRWAQFKEGEAVVYKPIPRDRDQAFAKIDGALLSLIKKLPPLRHMQSFKEDFPAARWMNKTAFPMDMDFLKSKSEADWVNQAKEIAATLTDAHIDEAFSKLPIEVQDDEMKRIIKTLKIRRSGLADFAVKYYKALAETVVVRGTDKKDRFVLTRLDNGSVQLQQYRAKKSGEEKIFERTYAAKETKEIWVYGLDDKDEFQIVGAAKAKIKVRLIGGQNHDLFQIDNNRKLIVYDYKTKDNTVESKSSTRTVYSDRYDLNNYDYRKVPLNVNMLLPNVGYNPDDGVKLGINYSSIRNNFVQEPFTTKHTFKANYSFATQGLDGTYKGFFANATNSWMFAVEAKATSPNFAQNFYGFGNETHYFDEEKGDDYKRVRIESYQIKPAYRYEGKLGGQFEIGASFETLKVEKTSGRFVTESPEISPDVFRFQNYLGAQINYDYERYNSKSKPTLGFGFHWESGWKYNTADSDKQFGFINTSLTFNVPIDRLERFVWASKFKYKARLEDGFDFYQAATLGGNDELRGFRPERFTGKQAFMHSSDVRWNIGEINGGLVPMQYGMLVGFDYGRVWNPGESSNKWHNSYGLGFWVNAIESLTLQTSYFKSVDGGRFVFGLGFGF